MDEHRESDDDYFECLFFFILCRLQYSTSVKQPRENDRERFNHAGAFRCDRNSGIRYNGVSFAAVSRGGGESQHSHRVCRAHLHDRIWPRTARSHELAALTNTTCK